MEQHVILLMGLPGTGKSSLAHELASRFPYSILSSDEIRHVEYSNPSYSKEETNSVFYMLHQRLEDSLRNGDSVIIDATNLSSWGRRQYYVITGKFNVKVVKVKVIAADFAVKDRLNRRTPGSDFYSDADMSIHNRMKSSVQDFTEEHLTIDTTSLSISECTDTLVKYLSTVDFYQNIGYSKKEPEQERKWNL